MFQIVAEATSGDSLPTNFLEILPVQFGTKISRRIIHKSKCTVNDLGVDQTATDLWDSANPLEEKIAKHPRFHLPPSTPDDIRLWFKSIVQRNKDKTETQIISQPINTLHVTVESGERDSLLPLPVVLSLEETQTVWHLTIVTSFIPDQPEQVERTNHENQGDTKNEAEGPKRTHSETQTSELPFKWKASETIDVRIVNSFINASAWDLYDTYAQFGEEVGFGIKEFQLLIDTALKTRGVVAAQFGASKITRQPADKQMQRLIKTADFQYCSLVIERLLSSKTFQNKQCLLKKDTNWKGDQLKPCFFSYEIKWLWTYDRKLSNSCNVTALDWNMQNDGLLAVGYEDDCCGCVCVWSPKNPSHPERKVTLPSQVTTVSFSKTSTNILAAGCRSGLIFLVDVAENDQKIRCFPRGRIKTKFGPVCKVEWVLQNGEENLIALGESGALLLLSLYDDNSSIEILSLDYTTQVSSLLVEPRVEYTAKSLSGLWFSIVPSRHCCYVSTKEGVIVKCVTLAPCGAGLRLSAHLGPVCCVQHSPAASLVFLSAGADHSFRIWVEGINEPLLTLYSPNRASMVFAQWSPKLPTVIATVSDSELELWDLARTVNHPITSLRPPPCQQGFSTMRFFPDGKGIVIGDQRGQARIYQLSQLPREPFLKVEALTEAVRGALVKHPRLLYKFDKLLKFHKNEFTTIAT